MKQSFIALGIAALSAVLSGASGNNSAVAQSPLPDSFNQAAVDQHNDYRKRHDAVNLQFDPSLAQTAQMWADRLAAQPQQDLTHSLEDRSYQISSAPYGGKYGENLYVTPKTSLPAAELASQAIKDWYGEITLYRATSPGFQPEAGHFTQIIWKRTTKVGCGVAQGKFRYSDGRLFDSTYVVCQYNPAGNVDTPTEYAKNISIKPNAQLRAMN